MHFGSFLPLLCVVFRWCFLGNGFLSQCSHANPASLVFCLTVLFCRKLLKDNSGGCWLEETRDGRLQCIPETLTLVAAALLNFPCRLSQWRLSLTWSKIHYVQVKVFSSFAHYSELQRTLPCRDGGLQATCCQDLVPACCGPANVQPLLPSCSGKMESPQGVSWTLIFHYLVRISHWLRCFYNWISI